MDPDQGNREIQRKVQFDIRYYFCRRGGENIHDMTIDSFELVYDHETQITYVKKAKDEMTKNHKENDSVFVTGFMPQMLDTDGRPHKMCPVRSYENYIHKLNPANKSLWQTPIDRLKNLDKPVWYKNETMGHNPLDTFMSKLGKMCNLSQHYTNHCIRVTGATNLFRGNFNAKQIMAVTGHKSIESLAVYQRVRSDEKLCMGMCLTFSLLRPTEANRIKAQIAEEEKRKQLLEANKNQEPNVIPAALKAIENVPIPPLNPNVAVPALQDAVPQPPKGPEAHALDPSNNVLPLDSALVPYNPQNDVVDIDFMDFVADNEDDEALFNLAADVERQLQQQPPATSATNNNTMMQKSTSNALTMPTFQGCSFGNIGTLNIHIHKK